jgi:glycosyltransferase involved in cell wall biosynthesis
LLLRAAQSVARQTHRDVEHIVVGNACPMLAGLERELREINPAIKLVHLPPPSEQAANFDYTPAKIARARNVGVVAASGDFVCHVDSDNTIDDDHVETLLAAATGLPGAQGAICYRKFLRPDGTPFLEKRHPWISDLAAAQKVYADRTALGIYRDADHVARERLFMDGHLIGLDTNVFLLRRQLHMKYLFPVDFTAEQLAAYTGEDDVLSARLYADGVVIAYSNRPTLNFYLGGEFTISDLPGTEPGPAGGPLEMESA